MKYWKLLWNDKTQAIPRITQISTDYTIFDENLYCVLICNTVISTGKANEIQTLSNYSY
jgi:hypothetical protein